jgi:hypothetical protein
MQDQINRFKELGLTIVGLVLVFCLGGYFGYRVQEINNVDEVTTLQAQVIDAQTTTQVADQPVEVLEVNEVFWLPPGGQSSCPENHPVKGKFTSTGNVAYSPTNKSYNRVRAHLCLQSIEFATQQAGFFQKQD